MGKNTSVSLGEHFEGFIGSQIATGRFSTRSEVVRSALRVMEEQELKIEAVRQALIEGEKSGPHTSLDMDEIIASARQKSGLDA